MWCEAKGPVHILAVLECRLTPLGIDVLIQTASQCKIQHLHAPANTQYRNLPVDGKAGQHPFLTVAVRIDSMKFTHRLFSEKQGIDVGSSGEQDTIYLFQ